MCLLKEMVFKLSEGISKNVKLKELSPNAITGAVESEICNLVMSMCGLQDF